jgi:hypothetical protein
MLGVVVVAAAACTGGDDPPRPQSAPEDTSPSGTDLADGFVVPDGAVLLGPLLPARVFGNGADITAPGWTALLEVVEDPLAVVEDLVRQAEAQGLTAPEPSGCPPGDLRPECSVCSDDLGTYRCGAGLAGNGRVLSIITARTDDADYAIVQAYPDARAVATDYIWQPTVAGPAPDDPPEGEAAAVGDELVDGFRLVEGSRPVGPVIAWSDTALVRIVDPDAEQAYIDQVLAAAAEPPQTTTVDRDGVQVRSTIGWIGAGGGELATIAFSQEGKPTYLLLIRMPD